MFCEDCTDDDQCEVEGALCDAGACVLPCADEGDCNADVPICDPGTGNCVGCVDSDDCPADAYCNATRCVGDVCVPGELACVSGDVRVCNDEGSAWDLLTICPEGMACSDDGAEPMCVVAGEGSSGDGADSTGGGGTMGGTSLDSQTLDSNSASNVRFEGG